MWELDCEESWAPKNWCFWTVVLEETLESTDAEAETPILCEELTHWKRPWCWEGLGAGGEGDDRGWDAWMASPTRWTWVWVNSGIWGWTGRPGVLQFMGFQSWTWLSDWTELTTFFTLLVQMFLLWLLRGLSVVSCIFFLPFFPPLSFPPLSFFQHFLIFWHYKSLLKNNLYSFIYSTKIQRELTGY